MKEIFEKRLDKLFGFDKLATKDDVRKVLGQLDDLIKFMERKGQ